MKIYFFSFRGITHKYHDKEECKKMALFCGLSEKDVQTSEFNINWKN